MDPFFSLYSHSMLRVGAAPIRIALADPAANAGQVIQTLARAEAAGAGLAVFPELCLSGYAIDDLLQQIVVLDGVLDAIERVRAASAELGVVAVVGAPLRQGGRLYNCAVVLYRGAVLGVIPKAYLPSYREFYERRHFTPGLGVEDREIELLSGPVPFGTDLVFAASDYPGFVLGVEICEDLWVPEPPSGRLAMAGATVIANLSASNITIGKARTRRTLCQAQSLRAQCAYVYAASGWGESTTDLAWDGHAVIYEAGVQLAESERFARAPALLTADVDLERLTAERLRLHTFHEGAERAGAGRVRCIPFAFEPQGRAVALERAVERFPYVPADPARLYDDCYEAYNIQVQGLVRRLESIGTGKVVIGVSGGLDSTQALIVTARAFDLLGWPRANIHAVTLPGFATGEQSKAYAWALMNALGVSAQEIDIKPACLQMLKDIGHPFAGGQPVYDVVFENVQAGLRTDYLFRLAGQIGGFVVGTGDLSELALGWCTYGVGDHMSHYNVNASVPKTLIQHLIRWVAAEGVLGDAVRPTLLDIVAAEISPELVPAGADGKAQSTEAVVGPYALQDFTLYYTLRYGFGPTKTAFLAQHAWSEAARGAWPPNYPEDARPAYNLATIKRWMTVFLHRFFQTSQYKRSAVPNGPKISSGGSLSPRGDWRAPSDGTATAWLKALEAVPDQAEG
ncbi:MAG TPA: NAD(+) synthase [Caulobacteraceae bacterium]|nr:NAD(+) synthase [Caulobacteraceae bacterium]